MNNIDFTDYERVTDILMWMSDNITLNFTVQLAKKLPSGERRFFQYETQNGVDAYNRPSRSIKRNMTYYFVIADREVFANGMVLKPQDVEILIMFIERKILPWYFGSPKELAFNIINDALVMKKYTPAIYTQSNQRYITFEPCIYTDENEITSQSIRMTMFSNTTIVMSIDKFMGFYHILKTDMYAVACSMVNYAKMQPYGINVFNTRGLGRGGGRGTDDYFNGSSTNKGNSFLDNSRSKKR